MKFEEKFPSLKPSEWYTKFLRDWYSNGVAKSLRTKMRKDTGIVYTRPAIKKACLDKAKVKKILEEYLDGKSSYGTYTSQEILGIIKKELGLI